jgi:four helix bundle protein
MNDYRKLMVWQKAMILAKLVYVYTKQLPGDERFGLVSQMNRCSVSIPSNIAEGSKRKSKKEFCQFLRISSGSLAELETQYLLSNELFPVITSNEIAPLILECQKMLESFIKKLES